MPIAYGLELTRFRSLLIATEVHFGLLTRPPNGTDMGGVLAEGLGYTVQSISLAETGVMCATNPTDINYTATGPWPTCPYFAIYAKGGTVIDGELYLVDQLIYWGPLVRAVASKGGPVAVAAGAVFVDWLNFAPAYNPQFGRGLRGNTQLLDMAAARCNIAVLSDLASSDVIVTDDVTLRGSGCATIIQRGLVAATPVGRLSQARMMDATRGRNTGFTISVPNGLAF